MSGESVHQRHRLLLAAMASDEVVANALERVGDREGRPPDLSWQRRWGRVDDPASGRARMVFQADNHPSWLCTIDVGATGGIADPVLGPIRVTLFPEDRRLPTLAGVMDDHIGAHVIRYRPGKRCTIRTAERCPRYIKVFGDGRARRLHAEGMELWEASQRDAFGFTVARPLGFDPRDRCYTQAAVTGHPVVDELHGPDGPALAHRLGYACASIPTSGLRPRTGLGPSTELARTHRRAAELAAYVPALRDRIQLFLAALERLHHELVEATSRPIHGSPHPDQWLTSGQSLGLVDFDRLSLGDPELDVATFTTEVELEAIDNRADVAASFQNGYRERYGPLDFRRLVAYRAHKRFAKVHRTAKAIRVDGDERAAVQLEAAVEAISELVRV